MALFRRVGRVGRDAEQFTRAARVDVDDIAHRADVLARFVLSAPIAAPDHRQRGIGRQRRRVGDNAPKALEFIVRLEPAVAPRKNDIFVVRVADIAALVEHAAIRTGRQDAVVLHRERRCRMRDDGSSDAQIVVLATEPANVRSRRERQIARSIRFLNRTRNRHPPMHACGVGDGEYLPDLNPRGRRNEHVSVRLIAAGAQVQDVIGDIVRRPRMAVVPTAVQRRDGMKRVHVRHRHKRVDPCVDLRGVGNRRQVGKPFVADVADGEVRRHGAEPAGSGERQAEIELVGGDGKRGILDHTIGGTAAAPAAAADGLDTIEPQLVSVRHRKSVAIDSVPDNRLAHGVIGRDDDVTAEPEFKRLTAVSDVVGFACAVDCAGCVVLHFYRRLRAVRSAGDRADPLEQISARRRNRERGFTARTAENFSRARAIDDADRRCGKGLLRRAGGDIAGRRETQCLYALSDCNATAAHPGDGVIGVADGDRVELRNRRAAGIGNDISPAAACVL